MPESRPRDQQRRWTIGQPGHMKDRGYLANSGQAHEISEARKQLAGYIKKSDGNVDMGKFKTRICGSKDLAGLKGWNLSEVFSSGSPHLSGDNEG